MAKFNNCNTHLSAEACNANLMAVGDALYAIGGKWKLRIIVALKSGSRRFNELQRSIDGISAKALATELKDLELNGFVHRNVFTGTPVVISYELTEYAGTLGDVLDALSAWGTMHRETIKKSMRKNKSAVL
ncbi:winged helix-turn-helix transcriptional regulator [Niabella beijingensis]|uniref:winged helix-turn-helix transcriptional regulator n=1 Tax=Niabella beijingensis TaxID=2872700 RepID=UPI001CBB6A24|nr:helix-turn-helix domain-containing protein [Niabella beijingensis]MBZ4189446.1 helix-turn-helix transcriptional regulator [Niabella beijingensis]